MENSIIALQEMVAHQGHEISQLSDELYTQQKEIASLRHALAKIESKFTELAQAIPQDAEIGHEPPPPHY